MVGEACSLASVADAVCRRLCDLSATADLRHIDSAFQHVRRELLDSGLLKRCLTLQPNLHDVAALMGNVSSFLGLITACNQALSAARSRSWGAEACDAVLVVLHLLQLLYQLCKDTQSAPGEALGELSCQLGPVFRQGFALQSIALGLLEEEFRESRPDAPLGAVCDRLCGLADLVQCLDPKALLNIWRLVSRLVAASPALASDDLSLLLSTLCSNLDAQIRLTVAQEPGAGFDNGLKLAVFLVKALLNLLGAVSVGRDDAATLVQFLLRLHTHMLAAHRLSDAQQTDLRCRLFFMADVVVERLLPTPSFAAALLLPADEQPAAQLCVLARALLHFHRLDGDDGARAAWLRGAAVFRRVFALLPRGALEVRLRRSGFDSGFVRVPDLYTFLLVAVCSAATCLADADFPDLESLLFSVLLTDSSRECRQLAEDCWCFLARFVSADLCRHHALLLVRAAETASPPAARRCRRLLMRLWPLLSERQQTELLVSLPLRRCPELWRRLPVRRLTPAASDEATRQMMDTGLEADEAVTSALLSAAAESLPSPRLTAWLCAERAALLRLAGRAGAGSALHASACRLLSGLLSAHPDLLQAAGCLADSDRVCSLALTSAVCARGGAAVATLRRLLDFLLSPRPLAAVTAAGAAARLACSAADDRILDLLSGHEGRETFEHLMLMQQPLSAEEVASLLRAGKSRAEDGSPASKRSRSLAAQTTEQEVQTIIGDLESAVSQLERIFHDRPASGRIRDRLAGLDRRLTALASDRPHV